MQRCVQSRWRRKIVIRRRATRQENEDGKGFGVPVATHRRMSRQNGKTTRTATDESVQRRKVAERERDSNPR